MASDHNLKSHEWLDGYVAGLVFISDIFEKHANAFVKKKLLRKIDVTLILNVLDAAIRRRELLAERGPDGVDLYISKKRTVSLKEK